MPINGQVQGDDYGSVSDAEIANVGTKVRPVKGRASTSISVAEGIIDLSQLGSWYFVVVPDIACTESHPISVSSIDSSNKSLTFHIKSMGEGTWSDNLNAHVKTLFLTVKMICNLINFAIENSL